MSFSASSAVQSCSKGRVITMTASRRLLAVAALASMPAMAHAQGGVLLQGVADVELWKTDAGSALLARNEGRAAMLGRLHLWGAWEPVAGLALYAMGEVEGGPAEGHTELELDQAGVRWTRSRALVADAGILTSPVGTFGNRRLSNRNPLIGAPDGYPVTYPLGAQLSGAVRMVDWRAAVVSLPVTRDGYTPAPSAAARPAAGIGITPTTGVRLGASWTAGPYLNCDIPTAMLAGQEWKRYGQTVASLDLQASRGYVELWAEAGRSAYEVPGLARPVRGVAGYVETRYTFTPRWYVAARAERNDYPYIELEDGAWEATTTDVRNLEAGIGFRPSSHQLVKATWRRDHWRVSPALREFLPDGHAIAVQFSQSFDVLGLADQLRR